MFKKSCPLIALAAALAVQSLVIPVSHAAGTARKTAEIQWLVNHYLDDLLWVGSFRARAYQSPGAIKAHLDHDNAKIVGPLREQVSALRALEKKTGQRGQLKQALGAPFAKAKWKVLRNLEGMAAEELSSPDLRGMLKRLYAGVRVRGRPLAVGSVALAALVGAQALTGETPESLPSSVSTAGFRMVPRAHLEQAMPTAGGNQGKASSGDAH